MINPHERLTIALTALLLLGGCATAVPPVEVTRFHAPDPVARTGGFLIEPMVAQTGQTIEFKRAGAGVGENIADDRCGFGGIDFFAARKSMAEQVPSSKVR